MRFSSRAAIRVVATWAILPMSIAADSTSADEVPAPGRLPAATEQATSIQTAAMVVDRAPQRVTPIGRRSQRSAANELPVRADESSLEPGLAFGDRFASSLESAWTPDTDGWICQADESAGPSTDTADGRSMPLDAKVAGQAVDGDPSRDGSTVPGGWRSVDFGLNPPPSAKVEIGAGVGVGLNFDAAGTFKSLGVSWKF
jgi:hypothetical protein